MAADVKAFLWLASNDWNAARASDGSLLLLLLLMLSLIERLLNLLKAPFSADDDETVFALEN